ncbi:MAG: hypothetical protein V1884_02815 [Candidatus Omnitrophota bacterium]
MPPKPAKKKRSLYKNIIYGTFFIACIFYLLPIVVITIKNLFKLVLFSGWRMDEFVKSIELFSIRPVNDFYRELSSWMKCLFRGVCSLNR